MPDVTLPDPDVGLAGEYALGLLTGDEAASVAARVREDRAFADAVDWWREHLADLATDDAVPPPGAWRRIEAATGANDNDANDAPLRRWRIATGAMGAIAAALLAVVVLRPPTIVERPVAAPIETRTDMIASLSGASGAAMTIAYEGTGDRRRLTVTPVRLRAGRGDAELWVIPAAGAPVSLGVIDAAAPAVHQVDAAHAALLAPGATFAVSQEVRGGSPTGAPQGPVVASGEIIRI